MNDADVRFIQECSRMAISLPPCEGAQFLDGMANAMRQDHPRRAEMHALFVKLASVADSLERISNGQTADA